jgi:hypothetical protein
MGRRPAQGVDAFSCAGASMMACGLSAALAVWVGRRFEVTG